MKINIEMTDTLPTEPGTYYLIRKDLLPTSMGGPTKTVVVFNKNVNQLYFFQPTYIGSDPLEKYGKKYYFSSEPIEITFNYPTP